jgi:hypothetical protein
MRQELPPGSRARRILTNGENDIIADCIRQGVYGARRLCRTSIGVNPNAGKVKTEPRFKKPARVSIQGRPVSMKHFMHNCRCYFGRGVPLLRHVSQLIGE